MNKIQEYTNIYDLLKAWNLLQLLQNFHDEDIGIEELKMMKVHHMTEILQKYNLGVRIRFEYHFERWRRKQNIPLERPVSYIGNNPEQRNNTVEKSNRKTSSTNTIISLAPQSTAQPQGTPDFFKDMLDLMNRTTWSTAPITEQIQTPIKQTTTNHNTTVKSIDLDVTENLPPLHPIQPAKPLNMETHNQSNLTQLPFQVNESPSPPPPPQPPVSERSLKQFRNLEGATPSLLTIIESSGVKGASILKFYNKHKQLTPTHRTLLIHLIVNYFDIYDYHLSLKMSYNLERQIVKMFPGEQLYNYRTEKRGKIYVKFCNMKRYKRERPGRKKAQTLFVGSIAMPACNDVEVIYDEPNIEEEDLTMGDDNDQWIGEQQDELMNEERIKTENLDDGY